MLLQFSASNFLSIADKQTLSLVATKLSGNEVCLVPVSDGSINALPSAIIYGANASGKTSFINAFDFFRSAILQSHARGNPEGGVPRVPFQLDEKYKEKPSEFEIDFVINSVRHQYGFACNDDVFTEEWLYYFPEGKRRKLFERSHNSVDFGSYFKGAKKAISDLMRGNSLFLSTATQNGHEELGKIVAFFRKVKFNRAVSVSDSIVNNQFREGKIDVRTIEFLNSIGTGVINYRQIEVEVPEAVKRLMNEFVQISRKHLGEGLYSDDISSNKEKNLLIELAHKGASGETHFLPLDRESSGTRRLLLIMNLVFKAIDEGGLVILDELDASLHTLAVEQVLGIFSNSNINKYGAQLIATTHDTNLLNSRYLRRDQIWFCEKDNFGGTSVYPLSEIKSRHSDNFEKGYLEGRYGAIPCSSDLLFLNGE